MNQKNDILNAWITIEQLSEGSINKKDKSLYRIHSETNNLLEFFTEFLNSHRQKTSEKNFKKSGIVMYFNIFNFQEIIDILRRQYKIPATHEETSNSDKFAFCLYFDNELNFLEEKLFLTMSGYVRKTGKLPKDFLQIENKFREELSKKFEDKGFNDTITELIQKDNATYEHFRYRFVKNLEFSDANLHSFFIDDLETAKKVETENLKRYFNGYAGEQFNLDSHQESTNFNPDIFEEILQPENYSLGRFPSNAEHALSFMQQTAVNLAFKKNNQISSVNGPPGTGKTTLLKDIFAQLVVEQALAICQQSDKQIKGSLVYWEQAQLGVLPQAISDNNIVVASSNNGAVQNIVMELPKLKEIGVEFQEILEQADYFTEISNSTLEVDYAEGRQLKREPLEKENWGVFSLEGGAASNVNHLLLTVEFIEQDLENEYEADPNVYKNFLQLYNQLRAERDRIQKYSVDMKLLLKLINQYQKKNLNIKQLEHEKRVAVSSLETKNALEIKNLNEKNNKLQHDLLDISSQIEMLNEEQAQAKRNFEILREQKPSLWWLQKTFNRSKSAQYIEKLNEANEQLNQIAAQKKNSLNNKHDLNNERKNNEQKIKVYQKQVEKEKRDFEQWLSAQQKELQNIERKIQLLEQQKVENDIKILDFSQTYEELQLSNPWFNKAFRTLQSELFIAALKVRKQFLFENKKHLKAARNIWSRQPEYSSKKNGSQLLLESWQWLNFAIPVVSTTFASFGRMFKNLHENTISNLFIDEAGQALPQASVGAIFRSKNVMVVGDPSQIKPVLTLDSNILNLIGRNYNVNEKFVSAHASTQSIIDRTSAYGYQKNEEEWVGIPLWVHRRSNYPMFTISNQISYNGLMVQGKEEKAAFGLSKWYDEKGKAKDKFVKEQAALLKNLINDRLQKNPKLKDDIYVISPFRNVAFQLANLLKDIGFTKMEKGKATNVGTVHTFQGKEAKIVYFVLGADHTSKGAAKWSVDEPNMMNVAATRAKEEFYVIGDKKLYASLGSKVANTTISIIDNYNK
ncbi:DEAD/DEAH box helicase [Gracilibacillus alcaliphilus]|uniref:DEAD/DEAH box helicase n=1 Tax=Gracilibacillus alcaliphilus TaxID=1401441 RepID=UPI00195EC672|nr:DEAD/DEAH box helicase [Gracilibacillus alcaliphilus]MBM7676159.1 superfamily I DNA and/or RNA helicase [Gracilibacillus alcaliphilus]